jgi:hypothetical protein
MKLGHMKPAEVEFALHRMGLGSLGADHADGADDDTEAMRRSLDHMSVRAAAPSLFSIDDLENDGSQSSPSSSSSSSSSSRGSGSGLRSADGNKQRKAYSSALLLSSVASPYASLSASASAPPEAPSLVVQATSRLTTIEAVFAEWGQYAVWHQDRTEIALWNSEIQAYSDCYEVLRNDGAFFFRSIPRLTHPLLTHGLQANLENCPIQFTETTAQRTTWLGEKNQETWRSISTAARENMGVASPAPTPPPPAPRP